MSGAPATCLFEVCDQTWPAAAEHHVGPWLLRASPGGGKRVRAASATGPVGAGDIAVAEAALHDLGQPLLFQVRPGDEVVDTELAARGYALIDPVVMLTAPIAQLMDQPIPKVTAFAIWEPLAIMEEIWAAGGIDAARLDVMARATVKTGILSRWNEKPAGVAFAACHADTCMVHAVEVLPHQRRQGVAQWMMRKAAFWGAEQGATRIAVLCVAQNHAALSLYRALGFAEAGHYHYRFKEGGI